MKKQQTQVADPVQKIVLPWDDKKILSTWNRIKERLTPEITSIVDLDSRIVSIHEGKFKSRCIIDIFSKYHSDISIKNQYSVEDLLKKIFPLVRELILDGKNIFKNYTLRTLTNDITTNVTLSRKQVACLIACGWFGLFNLRGYNYITRGKYRLKDFPLFGLLNLFQSGNVTALHCILKYFMAVYENLHVIEGMDDFFTNSNIIIHRRTLSVTPDWINNTNKLCEVNIINMPIDEYSEIKFKVNSSTSLLCENNFKDSINYEEIMFLMHPECMVSSLICSRLEDRDSVLILGAEKFSSVSGYGSNVRYEKDNDVEPIYGYDKDNTHAMIRSIIICVDPSKKIGNAHYTEDFDRDLNKLYCGFSALGFNDNELIATTHWSTVMYPGNLQLRFLQQLLAASASGKQLTYYVNSRDFEESVDSLIKYLSEDDPTVGDLYRLYKNIVNKYRKLHGNISSADLFSLIMED
jgi:poly(ADP-ribose) glycohydrolase